MTKYILSTGHSVISSDPLQKTEGRINYSISNEVEKAFMYDSIGEAMRAAVEVNKMFSKSVYKVIPIEINKN